MKAMFLNVEPTIGEWLEDELNVDCFDLLL
jgi:hypothetical protein